MRFEPKRHLIKVQGGRMYLPVSARLIWFRNEHPDWGIETDPFVIDIERQYAIFRCKIFDADGKLMAVGTKREDIRGFPDFIEKAETGSVGRALALCGFGTQFAPELDEVDAGRFADSPQPMRQPQNMNGRGRQPERRESLPSANDERGVPESAPDEAAPAASPACGKCSKPLTRSQLELSMRHYDEALCQACQKERSRTPQAAGGQE